LWLSHWGCWVVPVCIGVPAPIVVVVVVVVVPLVVVVIAMPLLSSFCPLLVIPVLVVATTPQAVACGGGGTPSFTVAAISHHPALPLLSFFRWFLSLSSLSHHPLTTHPVSSGSQQVLDPSGIYLF
jgi:hypothetical protein